jgi:formate dehydrogenase assembly factor FdhD
MNGTLMSTTLTPDHIMEVGMGFLASKTLLSAIELELFTVLGDASLTASETTAKLGLHERSHFDARRLRGGVVDFRFSSQ